MKPVDRIAKILITAIEEDSKSFYGCLIFDPNKRKAKQAIDDINRASLLPDTKPEQLLSLLDYHYPVLSERLCKAVVDVAKAHKEVEKLSRQKAELAYHPGIASAGVTIVHEYGNVVATRITANKIIRQVSEKMKTPSNTKSYELA